MPCDHELQIIGKVANQNPPRLVYHCSECDKDLVKIGHEWYFITRDAKLTHFWKKKRGYDVAVSDDDSMSMGIVFHADEEECRCTMDDHLYMHRENFKRITEKEFWETLFGERR